MILANLLFCGDSLQLLHAKSWHYNLQCTSEVKTEATAWATEVENVIKHGPWIKRGPQGTDLRTEEEKQHHLKPQQQRTTGKAASLFPLGHKASRHSFYVSAVSHIQQRGCACAG